MIPTLPFGRTGHHSTRAIFGAAALWSATEAQAARALELLLEHGVNHVDTAAMYGDSELRLAPWMAEHRERFFLATKTAERTFAGAREGIRRSLERMGVDRVDLMQLHNLVDPAEWETALGPGGALEAVVEAREEGLVRFVGVTGHGLAAAGRHLSALARYDFDSVLLPYSYVVTRDQGYAADFDALARACSERGVAVQTIKAIVRAPWGEREPARTTWYEPLEDQESIDLAVHWVLGREGIFLDTAGDLDLLPRVLDAAARFESRPADAQMETLAGRGAMAPLFTS